jgi:hypothetical protein
MFAFDPQYMILTSEIQASTRPFQLNGKVDRFSNSNYGAQIGIEIGIGIEIDPKTAVSC